VTKTCLRVAMLMIAGALIGAGAALAEETKPKFSHPADAFPVPGSAGPSSAFDFAVPMIDRPAAHPSYGPAPSEGAGDAVEQMDQMMEVDHSAHQMPGMDMNNMPGMDHSGHQMPSTMPGMNYDTTPENPQ
jgi:uncharacterized protein involved in copper resistance